MTSAIVCAEKTARHTQGYPPVRWRTELQRLKEVREPRYLVFLQLHSVFSVHGDRCDELSPLTWRMSRMTYSCNLASCILTEPPPIS